MNAVERIDNYATIVPIEEDDGKKDPDASWPSKGEIKFVNYYGAYDKELDSVLQDVTVTVSGAFCCCSLFDLNCD